jgi:hypothetical protein
MKCSKLEGEPNGNERCLLWEAGLRVFSVQTTDDQACKQQALVVALLTVPTSANVNVVKCVSSLGWEVATRSSLARVVCTRPQPARMSSYTVCELVPARELVVLV